MKNRKELNKLLIVIILIGIIIALVSRAGITLSRYSTKAQTEANVDVAFWIVKDTYQSESFLIKDLYPRTEDFTYTIAVSNFDGLKRAQTDMEYEITITTTTNLPVDYSIKMSETVLTKEETIIRDASRNML